MIMEASHPVPKSNQAVKSPSFYSKKILGGNPKKRFFKFILIMALGLMTSVVAMRLGMKLTPESFRNFVSSLGVSGPIIYILIFFVRPFFAIFWLFRFFRFVLMEIH